MKHLLVTGSAGLIGSESVDFFAKKGFLVVGVDNDMRKYFFGEGASTVPRKNELQKKFPNYVHFDADIRDQKKMGELFKKYPFDLIIHTAAQPSHDWAVKDPNMDFTINANGTLNLLEQFRIHTPKAVFIYTSTNKVYGDNPNKLPLTEMKTRYEIDPSHHFQNGIDETMSIDSTTHSIFGASKLAGDILVQEYGLYFGLKTTVFRGGCLTGPMHAGAKLHGFLSYLCKCIITETPYTIYGYKGKQVRDNIHAHDFVNACYEVYKKPKKGAVYNMGGSRESNISVLEAISLIERITGKKARISYLDTPRIGDHMWYISDVTKFKNDYPKWKYTYSIENIVKDIIKHQLSTLK